MLSTITEKTSVSWPVLISIVAAALGMGGILTSVNNLSVQVGVNTASITELKLSRETDRGEVNMVKANLDGMKDDLKDIKIYMQQLTVVPTRTTTTVKSTQVTEP